MLVKKGIKKLVNISIVAGVTTVLVKVNTVLVNPQHAANN